MKGKSHIAELLLKNGGIDVSRYDDTFLHKSIQKRITETRSGSPEAYFSLLEHTRGEEMDFTGSLRISYSEFFRNPLTFAVLEAVVLPLLVLNTKNKKHGEIRIWSAACAAGQEPYSLAMLLEELKTGVQEKTGYRIFATDLDESQVAAAQKGHFTADALNNLTMKRIDKWFCSENGTYTIKPELKKNIEFSVFDLFNKYFSCPPESIFGDFDLVLCANLLFYYKPEYRSIILKKVGNSLTTGGYIVAGEAERDILKQNGFKEIFPQSAIFRMR